MLKTEESINAIVEVRKAVMVSSGGANPTFRVAHFLKPSLSTSEETVLDPVVRSLFSVTTATKLKEIPLQVIFNGWLPPQVEWKMWVERLRPKFETLWRKVGIFEAIMSSTYSIMKDSNLIIKLGERWCTETSSFIFPWGEATITLEDMMICGGYSVLGSPVVKPLQSEELTEIEAKLDQVRRMLLKTKAKKAAHLPWIRFFLENKSQVEHEAFLTLWLSRFVLPKDTISYNLFPIAIHLARGKRIALAPAVLANLYSDLSLLEVKIRASSEPVCYNGDEGIKNIVLWAPFQLLQIWVFERFPALQPQPLSIKYGEPRIARWHNMKKRKNDDNANVRLALDSAGSSFNWRPYTVDILNGKKFKFYGEKEMQPQSLSDSDQELLSFAYCLRPSALVSLDCIELYLPHRVAMQFGFDQDLPGLVGRCNRSPSIAWNNYKRSVIGVEIYLSSTTYKPTVTSRYLKWWEKLNMGTENAGKDRRLSGNTCSTSRKSSHNSGCRGNRDNAGNPGGDDKKFNASMVCEDYNLKCSLATASPSDSIPDDGLVVGREAAQGVGSNHEVINVDDESEDCIPHTTEKTKEKLKGAQVVGSNHEVINVDDEYEECIPHTTEKTKEKLRGAQVVGSNHEVINVADESEECIPHTTEKTKEKLKGAQVVGSNHEVINVDDESEDCIPHTTEKMKEKLKGAHGVEEVVNVDDNCEDCIPHTLEKTTVDFAGSNFYDEEVVNGDDNVEDCIPHTFEKKTVESEEAENVDSSYEVRGLYSKEVVNDDDNDEDCIPITLEKAAVESEGVENVDSSYEVRGLYSEEVVNDDDNDEDCIPITLEKAAVESEGVENVDSSYEVRGLYSKEVVNDDDNDDDCIPITLEKEAVEFEGAENVVSNKEMRSSYNDEDDNDEDCIPITLEKAAVEFEGAENADSNKEMRSSYNDEDVNDDDNDEDCIPITLEKEAVEFEGAETAGSNKEMRSSYNDEDVNKDEEAEESILQTLENLLPVEFEARLRNLEISFAKFQAAYF